jgi:hypothetical protein
MAASNVPIPSSPRGSAAAAAAATSAFYNEDPLTAALRALSGQDQDIAQAMHFLASEMRQQGAEFTSYMEKNEAEKRSASARFDRILMELADLKKGSESAIQTLSSSMTQLAASTAQTQSLLQALAANSTQNSGKGKPSSSSSGFTAHPSSTPAGSATAAVFAQQSTAGATAATSTTHSDLLILGP